MIERSLTEYECASFFWFTIHSWFSVDLFRWLYVSVLFELNLGSIRSNLRVAKIHKASLTLPNSLTGDRMCRKIFSTFSEVLCSVVLQDLLAKGIWSGFWL